MSRPSSFSGDNWRRPLTYDNIWSNQSPNINSSTSPNSNGFGSGFGTNPFNGYGNGNYNMNYNGNGYGYGNSYGNGFNNYGGFNGQRNSISSISSLDYDRRNSHNDIYDNLNSFSLDMNNLNINGPPMNMNPNLNPPINNSTYPELNQQTIDSINEYFGSDPHQRVKVDLNFLNSKLNSEMVELPKFPIENSIKNYQLILVGFKCGRLDIFYSNNKDCNIYNYKIGDLVIVEADRGKDLGKVLKLNLSIDEVRLLKFLQFKEQQEALNEEEIPNNLPILHFPKSIIGLANNNEILQILNKKKDEENACKLCLSKINSPFLEYLNDVNMRLIDAEYQFDRKKLIFYYSTNKRIDFRDLVKELFRTYKTRIWMCAVIGLPFQDQSVTQNHPQSQYQSQWNTNTNWSNWNGNWNEVPRGIIDNDYKINVSRGSGSIGSINSVGSIGPISLEQNKDPERAEVNDELFVLKSLVDQIDH